MKIADLVEQKRGVYETDLRIQHHFSDGLYTRQMNIPAGYAAASHAHAYSHFSILARGRVIVKTDDAEQAYAAPACIEIKAGVHHLIYALEDATWFCIHATNETNVAKIDDVLIERGKQCH